MATKKPQVAKNETAEARIVDGVDAEISYQAAAKVAAASTSDKQWLEETAERWEKRDSQEKDEIAKRDDGQAVMVVADASGAVGSSLVVADASTSEDNKKAVVADKKDDSDDKGGYLWGGLGLLGLIGVAAAAGGGGGGGSSPAPLNLDGLVIDDPVANAIVFRDYYGDGYLHVIAGESGGYVIDPNQSVVITDEHGDFSHLGGSGRIISAGINALPIKVIDYEWSGDDTDTQADLNAAFDADVGDKQVAGQGDILFTSLANFNNGVEFNDGNFAHIVGEDQIFNSLVISSGIDLTVGGSNVTLVTGVTALVDAYLNRFEGDFDPTNEADVKAATAQVAALFGYELDAHSSDQEYMSFLLGGYDVAGIDSPNNLNQEIYAVINSIFETINALGDSDYNLNTETGVTNYLAAFQAALNAILVVQEARTDGNLETISSPLLIADIVSEAVDIINIGDTLVNEYDRQLLVDIAVNHATSGGGAADIYKTDEDGNLVNMVQDGEQLYGDEVLVAGDITVLAARDYDQVSLDMNGGDGHTYDGGEDGVQLMGSNINVIAYGEDSYASLYLEGENATGVEMANNTLTYDAQGESVALGNITIQALEDHASADAFIRGMNGNFAIAGDIDVLASGNNWDNFTHSTDTTAQLTLIPDTSSRSDVTEIDLHNELSRVIDHYSENSNPTLNLRLEVDGKMLTAAVALNSLNYDNIYENIADIVSQWKDDPDYSTLAQNSLEYWGDNARIRFDDVSSHDVSVTDTIGGIQQSVDIVGEDGFSNGDFVEFQGTDIDVTADGYSADAGFGMWNGAGATGTIDGLHVTAVGDRSSASADLSGSITYSGEINVTVGSSDLGSVDFIANESYRSSDFAFAGASLDTNHGAINFDGTTINVTSNGYETWAMLDVGEDNYFLGEDSVQGDIAAITVSALGDNSSAEAIIRGDVTINGPITVEAGGYGNYNSADLELQNEFDGNDYLASSAITYDDVEISVIAHGNYAYASLDAYNTNANGSITSIVVEADAEGAEDGGMNSEYATASADITIAGTLGDVTVSALTYGDNASLDVQSTDRGHTTVDLQDSVVLVEAMGDYAESYVSVDSAVGTIHSIELNTSADHASSSAHLSFDGAIDSSITLVATGAYTSSDLQITSVNEGLVYNNIDISLAVDGVGSQARYSQSGTSSGDVNSITLSVNGSQDATVEATFSGDLTVGSVIDIFAQNRDDQLWVGEDSDAYLNLESETALDDVVINIESRGFAQAYLDANDSDGLLTGSVHELNVLAGLYTSASHSEDFNPNNVSGSLSSISADVDAVFETINVNADHSSEAYVYLNGTVATNDALTIDVVSANNGYSDISIDTIVGDIASVNVTTTEDAETYMYLSVDGSINQFDIETTTDGLTRVSLDINGQNNFVEDLTISTIGTSDNAYYTATTAVYISQEAHGGDVYVNNSAGGNFEADTLLSYRSGNYQADTITLGNNGHDRYADSFWLSIDMADVDVFGEDDDSQTMLQDNMTTVIGMTNAVTGEDSIGTYFNELNNYIQFGSLDDDNYTFEPSAVGNQPDLHHAISHYSDGLNGWETAVGTLESQNISDGFYGSFSEFFDAAQYGIASEYTFVDLNQFKAANYSGGYTNVALDVTYIDAYGQEHTIHLDKALGDNNYGGNLGDDVDDVVAGLNSDGNWNEDETNEFYTETNTWADNDTNLQLFNDGNGLLGIRIGEGMITAVHFDSATDRYDRYDDGGWIYTGDSSTADAGHPGTLYDNQNFDNGSIQWAEGGGYFFGMVLNDDEQTYRGVLAMDTDGEGVTKLIELADVTATDDNVNNFLDSDGDFEDVGYDEFNANYIASAYDDGLSTYGLYYNLNAQHSPDFI